MLDLLFHANDENVSMKTKILKDKYHIIIDEKEVNAMCSLGEGIEYIGIQKGMQQGMQQGIQKGREVEKIDNAISFINSGIPSNEVYKILGVNKDIQKKNMKTVCMYQDICYQNQMKKRICIWIKLL